MFLINGAIVARECVPLARSTYIHTNVDVRWNVDRHANNAEGFTQHKASGCTIQNVQKIYLWLVQWFGDFKHAHVSRNVQTIRVAEKNVYSFESHITYLRSFVSPDLFIFKFLFFEGFRVISELNVCLTYKHTSYKETQTLWLSCITTQIRKSLNYIQDRATAIYSNVCELTTPHHLT